MSYLLPENQIQKNTGFSSTIVVDVIDISLNFKNNLSEFTKSQVKDY